MDVVQHFKQQNKSTVIGENCRQMASIYLHQDNFVLQWKTVTFRTGIITSAFVETPPQTVTDPSKGQTMQQDSCLQHPHILCSLLTEDCYLLHQHKTLNGTCGEKVFLRAWPCNTSSRFLLLKERQG